MDLIEELKAVVGDAGLLLGDDVKARPNLSWGMGSCPAKAIVRPASTEEVSRVMRLCHQRGQTVVPWGGLTTMVNGITCTENDIALSLERMRTIERLDVDSGVMTVQAGVVLQNAQQAALEAGWQLAMDWGGRGSAQIGGAISTNAGGNSVVRYGMTREQVLGLEAVLADGTVISSMNEMLKNNAAYDIKHLFIGSEGTLGIVTRAVLRLRPATRAVQTAFVALDSFGTLIELLRRLGVELEGKLSAFEVMWNSHYRLMTEETGRHQLFLPADHPYYVLLESAGANPEREQEHFMAVMGSVLEDGLVADAVIAQSGQQAEQLWAMRDDVEVIVAKVFPAAGFDVSLPLRDMEAYVAGVEAEIKEKVPGARIVTLGHVGDGNIHFAIGPLTDKHMVESIVYERLRPIGGSISAEHGIGLEKKEFLGCSRSPAEIALMKSIKNTLDPKGILNPGKVFL